LKIISKVAYEVENDPFFIKHQSDWDFSAEDIYDAVSQSIAKTVSSIGGKAIVAFSESGYTSRMVARYRPRVPILVPYSTKNHLQSSFDYLWL
jgi:pyruvate kinase